MRTEDIGGGWMLTTIENHNVGITYSATLRTPWNETFQADKRFRKRKTLLAWATNKKAQIQRKGRALAEDTFTRIERSNAAQGLNTERGY